MNPFLLAILRSVAIRIIGMVAAALVAADLMTPEQFEAIRESGITLVLSVLIVVATFAWSIFTKYWERLKLLVALRGANRSEKMIEAEASMQIIDKPSVRTPKTVVPR